MQPRIVLDTSVGTKLYPQVRCQDQRGCASDHTRKWPLRNRAPSAFRLALRRPLVASRVLLDLRRWRRPVLRRLCLALLGRLYRERITMNLLSRSNQNGAPCETANPVRQRPKSFSSHPGKLSGARRGSLLVDRPARPSERQPERVHSGARLSQILGCNAGSLFGLVGVAGGSAPASRGGGLPAPGSALPERSGHALFARRSRSTSAGPVLRKRPRDRDAVGIDYRGDDNPRASRTLLVVRLYQPATRSIMASYQSSISGAPSRCPHWPRRSA